MLIGGVQKVTFIDFPGKIAAICFTMGCNLKCRYCYNNGFVLPEKIQASKPIPQHDVFQFLKQRRGFLDGVVICGGEPCIHADLPEFLKKIKDLGYAIKLDTNGFMPQTLQNLINQDLIDYVALDLKYTPEELHTITQKKLPASDYEKSLKTIQESGIPYELRTTVIKGYHTQKRLIAMIKNVGHIPRYVLQNFFPTDTMVDPLFDGKSFCEGEMNALGNAIRSYVGEYVLRR